MFERFTDGARRTVVRAQEESRLLQHNWIGTEHLLLGLLHDDAGPVAPRLHAKGLTLEATRRRVEQVVGPGDERPSAHIPFTPPAKQALETSLREAVMLGHNYIGTEHILLGVVAEGQSAGATVLGEHGVDLEWARVEVGALADDEPTDPFRGAAAPVGVAGVTGVATRLGAGPMSMPMFGSSCSFCGRDLWEVERYVASSTARICSDCVKGAGQAIEAALSENRSPTEPLRLPPRVFGPEPPDDDAVSGVVQAFDMVFGGPPPDDDTWAASLEDGAALVAVMREARARYENTATGVAVERLRFVNAVRVQVRFTILLGAGGMSRDGAAVRHEGRWQVSRETFCQLMSLAGLSCPPRR